MKILRVIVKAGLVTLITSTEEEKLYFNIRYELNYNGEKYYFLIDEFESDGTENIICKMREDGKIGKVARKINYRDLVGKELIRLSLKEAENIYTQRLESTLKEIM